MGGHDSRSGWVLGGYQLLEELGRGGMGVVHRARELATGRDVALKLLPALGAIDDDAVARFEREARAAARIDHPGVIAVHRVGCVDGAHFFVMDYVAGPSLERLVGGLIGREPGTLRGSILDESGLSAALPAARRRLRFLRAAYARSCAALLADAAEALAAAHAVGVVHRDVKPSNVMLRHDGAAVVVDFGLAREAESGQLTRSGDLIGTPSYMAPEQARGDRDVDARADVWGLGATLYELLALRPPFDGPHPGAIMRRILDEEPTALETLHPDLPPALIRIVRRCLRKSRDQRYATASEVAEDLRVFIAGGDPVGAPPSSRWQRLRRLGSRRGRALAMTTLSVAAAGLAFALAGVVEGSAARDRARAELATAHGMLAAGRFAEVERAYAAAAALGAQAVGEARREHAERLFERLYARGLFDELTAWLDTWPTDVRDAAWREWRARARGLGRVEFEPPLPPGAEVVAAAGAAVHVDRLAIGWHWLAVRAPGVANETHRVRVERDRTTVVRRAVVPAADAPPAAVLVPCADGAVWLDRHEFTRADLEALAERTFEPELRRELLEVLGTAAGSPARPLAGLAVRDAARIAVLAGGRLPAVDELRAALGGADLAAPAGALLGRGDLDGPQPAAAGPGRRSPRGLIDPIGNVAELAWDDGRAVAFGGAWHDPPAVLETPPQRPLDRGAPGDGLRVARHAAWPDRPVIAAALEAARAAARATAGGVLDFDIGADGRIGITRRAVVATQAARDLRDSTRGFRDLDRRSASESGGIWTESIVARSGTAIAARAGGWTAVLGFDASVVVVTVTLPTGGRCIDADPRPEWCAAQDGRQLLGWDRAALGATAGELWIRVRQDGVVGDGWPARRNAEQIAAAVGAGLWPPGAIGGAPATARSIRVVGTAAFGTTSQAELLVDWELPGFRGDRVTVHDWPLRLGWSMAASDPWSLAVGRLDTGQVRTDLGRARYEHDGLGLRFEVAAGDRLQRTGRLPAAVEWELRPGARAGWCLQVTGDEVADVSDDDAVVHALSGGAAALRPGRLLEGPSPTPFPLRGLDLVARRWVWLFDADDAWGAEEWTAVRRGSTALLLRRIATGRSAAEARARLTDPEAGAWFERALAGLSWR